MEYLMTLPIENFRLFCCIANSLEDGCLPRIGAANDKDAKTPGEISKTSCSSLLSFYILWSLKFGIGKRHLSQGYSEMVEVMKNQCKRAGSVLFGSAGSATGVTSLTPTARSHFFPFDTFQFQ